MREDDLLYGAHSGIQKAVRRGDLDLAKTCFDALWPDSKHRNWLKWRVTILVEEDVWYMLGELAQFFKEVKGLKGEEEERAWRKFLYQLAVCQKSKDTEALYYLALGDYESSHPEMEEMKFRLNLAETDAVEVAEELVEEERKNLSEYELGACRVLTSRMKMGGMAGDRMACLSAIVLIISRGLKEAEVQKKIDEGVRRHKRSTKQKPRSVNLPWYVFDFHTAAGKMASSVFIKRKGKEFHISKEKLEDAWFFLESARIPKEQIHYVPFSDDASLSPFDTMWWPVLVKRRASGQLKRWKDGMREDLKGLVEWCVEKRR